MVSDGGAAAGGGGGGGGTPLYPDYYGRSVMTS